MKYDDDFELKFNPNLLVQDYDTFSNAYSMDKYIAEQKLWNSVYGKDVHCTAIIDLPNWLKY